MSNEEQKRGFFARRKDAAKNYTFQRMASPFMRQAGSEYVDTARHAILPRAFDKADFLAGYNGRYKDGGRARFQEIIAEEKRRLRVLSAEKGVEMSLPELPELAKARRRASLVMFAGFGLSFIASIFFLINQNGGLDIFAGIAAFLGSMIFLGLAAQHDFSRWQIQERRMGGFREYLRG